MVGDPPTGSPTITAVTTYLWNQSRIGSSTPLGFHFTGMHRRSLLSGASGICLPRTQSWSE